MMGFSAINAHNGWAISFLGICIVFTGLTGLSFAISQLHKILDGWDRRGEWFKSRIQSAAAETEDVVEIPESMRDQAKMYGMIVQRLGQPFSLPKLIRIAEKRGLPKPHSTINQFIHSGLIVPDKKGYFFWKPKE